MCGRTTMSGNANRFIWGVLGACVMVAVALAMMSQAYAAGPVRLADTYTATTTGMTPDGLTLRVQIISWQDDDARAEAVATLASGAEAAAAIAKLPTVGYVWPKGSPVGYSLKYTRRTPTTDGGERITLVTDKRLGSYDFRGWSVPSPVAQPDAPYSVIELYLDRSGAGTGALSLAAEVKLDEATGTVALADGAPTLLKDVKREPTPQ